MKNDDSHTKLLLRWEVVILYENLQFSYKITASLGTSNFI